MVCLMRTCCLLLKKMYQTTDHTAINGLVNTIPGKRSLRLAGGLFVSRVSLWTAVFTGNTGLMTSLVGRLALVVVTRRPPEKKRGQKRHMKTLIFFGH